MNRRWKRALRTEAGSGGLIRIANFSIAELAIEEQELKPEIAKSWARRDVGRSPPFRCLLWAGGGSGRSFPWFDDAGLYGSRRDRVWMRMPVGTRCGYAVRLTIATPKAAWFARLAGRITGLSGAAVSQELKGEIQTLP